MKLSLLLAFSIVATSPSWIRAQLIAKPPARSASDVIDSLKAGRKRWARAQVREYQLQSHVGCFCGYTLERLHNQLPLLTVRNRAIIARAKGKPNKPPSPAFTVEGLFAKVEEDAQSTERVIDRLDLHPVYGFPVRYEASDPEVLDGWLQVQVDSFAVIRKR